MNFEVIRNSENVLKNVLDKGLLPGIYTLVPNLDLVVHQTLTNALEMSYELTGTVCDLKHRQGKTQKIYRIQSVGERFKLIVVDSEKIFHREESVLVGRTVLVALEEVIASL